MNRYNLEERTLIFGIAITRLCQRMGNNKALMSLIDQLIRSGTSIGANYREANGASSRRDFKNKIFICKKEAKETEYWLKILYSVHEDSQEEISKLVIECHELVLIFSRIVHSAK